MNYWGPIIWKVIHLSTYRYSDSPSEEQQKIYRYFYHSVVPAILPCPKCRKHWIQNLQFQPVRLKNRHKLKRWAVDIHNRVNHSLKKKIYSYEESENIYQYCDFSTEFKILIEYLQKRVRNGRLSITMFQYFTRFIVTSGLITI